MPTSVQLKSSRLFLSSFSYCPTSYSRKTTPIPPLAAVTGTFSWITPSMSSMRLCLSRLTQTSPYATSVCILKDHAFSSNFLCDCLHSVRIPEQLLSSHCALRFLVSTLSKNSGILKPGGSLSCLT